MFLPPRTHEQLYISWGPRNHGNVYRPEELSLSMDTLNFRGISIFENVYVYITRFPAEPLPLIYRILTFRETLVGKHWYSLLRNDNTKVSVINKGNKFNVDTMKLRISSNQTHCAFHAQKRTHDWQANGSPVLELTSHRIHPNWSIMTPKELSMHNDAEDTTDDPW